MSHTPQGSFSPRRLAHGIAAWALFVVLCSFGLVVTVADPASASGPDVYQPCAPGAGVTVVVDFHDEDGRGYEVRCAPGNPGTGLQALTAAGFDFVPVSPFPTAVCQINSVPHTSCNRMPPTNAYWSYWRAPGGGAWQYSDLGAASQPTTSGTTEGWSFARSKPTPPEPRRSPPAPTPTTTAPPVTAPATTLPTGSGSAGGGSNGSGGTSGPTGGGSTGSGGAGPGGTSGSEPTTGGSHADGPSTDDNTTTTGPDDTDEDDDRSTDDDAAAEPADEPDKGGGGQRPNEVAAAPTGTTDRATGTTDQSESKSSPLPILAAGVGAAGLIGAGVRANRRNRAVDGSTPPGIA